MAQLRPGLLQGRRMLCKACTSEHRAWIERLRGEGVAANVIAAKLKQEFGESVSGESLRRHFRHHFDVRSALAEKYAASDALRDVAAGKRLSDIQRLDAVIDDCSKRSGELGRRIDEIVAEGKAPPMAVVEAYKTATAEMRQAIKQKADLLGDQPTDGVDRLLAALWGGEQVQTAAAVEDDEVDASVVQ